MYDSTLKVKLQEQWEWISEDWKELFARNLSLGELFSREDLDYILTLEELDCYESKISELTPLYLMPQLRLLELRHLEICDFTPVSSLKNLQVLSSVFCSLGNTSILSGLARLEVLDLSYPLVDTVDLSGLSNLTSLRELYCNACDGISLYDIIHLPNLEVVSFYFTKLHPEEVKMFRKAHPNCQFLY